MKSVIIGILFLIAAGFSLSANSSHVDDKSKCAILVVHFGSTNDETRAKNIDALNNTIKNAFPDYEIRDAYTSRIVIDRLSKKGIEKDTPAQALEKLHNDGFAKVIVQTSHLLPAVEYEALKEEMKSAGTGFGEVLVSVPLLYSLDDSKRLAGILAENYGEEALNGKIVVFIGHGSESPANALYSQLNYILNDMDCGNMLISTIEGYPDYDTTLRLIKQKAADEIILVPLMFVAGEHFSNDINKEWKEKLENEGYTVAAVPQGLGEISEVRQMYVNHILETINGEIIDPVTQKQQFIKENL